MIKVSEYFLVVRECLYIKEGDVVVVFEDWLIFWVVFGFD